MPLSKRERKKAWRNLLATKYELKDRGYELEVDEFVRRKLGEKQREASFNPWMAYLKVATILCLKLGDARFTY